MKTSNKLLLGIFLTILILIATVQLTVYAKYKRGDYTAFKREEIIPMTSLALPPARFISIKDIGACSIKPSDTLKMEIQKVDADIIKFKVEHDTLVITTNPTGDGGRNNTQVNIYLPASVQLNGANCTFGVKGTSDLASAPSYNINLKDSYLFINAGINDAGVFIDRFNITSIHSMIDLSGHVLVNDLNLDFTDSKLNDKSGAIRKMTVRSDDKSTLELSAKNANALK